MRKNVSEGRNNEGIALGENIYTDSKSHVYNKTVKLLSNYLNLKRAVGEREDEINYIKHHGLPQKTNSIIKYIKNEGLIKQRTAEDKIEEIEKVMNKTQHLLMKIEGALQAISEDEYFEIIPMVYFRKCSREEIAEYFNVEAKTITRQKNKLVNQMGIILFSEEFSSEFIML